MKTPDVYDNERRFLFSNWTNEDFVGRWENSLTTIKAGQTLELPMYKAYNFCKHLVDREMQRDGKEHQMAIEEARDPYEVKTIAEITADMDSPALATLKDKIRAELEAETKPEMKNESVGFKPAEAEKEFAELEETPKVVAKKKTK